MELSTHLSEPGHLELFASGDGTVLPCIIVLAEMDEAAAGSDRDVAHGLAQSGYAVLLVSVRALQSETFQSMLARIETLPLIDPQRLALMGLGAGAELALNLAAEHGRIRAVVAVAPGTGALAPVEQIAAPILLLAGMDDARWPAVEVADQIIERLASHRFAHGVSLHSYGNAGHRLFGPPLAVTDPTAQRLCESGGSLEGNLRARRDSWRKTLDFLEDCIGGASGTMQRSVLVHDEGWIGRRGG